MRVGNEIKNVSTPRPVHASDDEVAVERGAKSSLLIHRPFERLGSKTARSRNSPRTVSRNHGFRLAHVAAGCKQQAIQVLQLDDVIIHNHNIFEAGPSQALDDKPTDTAGSDDADAQPHYVPLFLLPPRGHSADLSLGCAWRRGQPIHESNFEALAHDANSGAVTSGVLPLGDALPKSSAPSAIAGDRQADEGQTRRAENSPSISLLRGNIVRTSCPARRGRRGGYASMLGQHLTAPPQREHAQNKQARNSRCRERAAPHSVGAAKNEPRQTGDFVLCSDTKLQSKGPLAGPHEVDGV